MRRWCIGVVVGLVMAAGSGVHAQAVGEKPCAERCYQGASAVVRLSTAPPAPLGVSLLGDNGSHIDLEFDPAADDPLVRRVELDPEVCYTPAISSKRFMVPNPAVAGATLTLVQNADSPKCERLEQAAGGAKLSVGDGRVPAPQRQGSEEGSRKKVRGSAGKMTSSVKTTVMVGESRGLDKLPAVSINLPSVEVVIDVRPKDDSTTGAESARASGALRSGAIRLDGAALVADVRGFGLDAKVPDAVVEVLRLLGEIAVDKAKAEGMRLFKERLVERVCGEITIGKFFAAAGADGALYLLPATCGQLENLRLGDLGGSARGLLTALREDLATVVVPTLLDRLNLAGDPAVVQLVSRLVVRASSGQLSSDEIRLAVVGLVFDRATKAIDTLDPSAVVRRAMLSAVVNVAALCATQGCSSDEVLTRLHGMLMPDAELGKALRGMLAEYLLNLMQRTILVDLEIGQELAVKVERAWSSQRQGLIDEVNSLLNSKTLSMELAEKLLSKLSEELRLELQNALKEKSVTTAVDAWLKTHSIDDATRANLRSLVGALPELASAVARIRTVLAPGAGTTPRAQAAEVIAVLLDLVETTQCGTDDGSGNSLCRAKISAMRNVLVGVLDGDYLRALGGVSTALHQLSKDSAANKGLALLASVMSYVDTYQQTKDEDPKVAREQRKKALEALIEAGTDRSDRVGWVSSLGALVGYQVGQRKIHNREAEVGQDLRLALGISALYLFPPQKKKAADEVRASFFANLAIADLALLVASTTNDELEPELHWSDFVEISGQVGFAWGRRLPLVFGVSAGWAPGLRYVTEGSDPAIGAQGGRGVFRAGVFLGIHVPFFDLN